MLKIALLLAATTLTISTASAGEPDEAAGESLYASSCAQCHGPGGKGMASFPSLAGRDSDYIASRLMQYRDGERVGANSGLMIPNAAGLSDDDIANLAAFISNQFQ
ncbi:c-type cytochrome [Halomonas sp. A11-A]|jgi:cytochrome c553|uniref:c-type cytochrome n=1 Tax=Halomonas sp. A11-A TaxID=2183985 RepID=UPI000D710008|nr:c-type cytochrome [Halomonas sp. A11-A]PWV77389.1 cytochrome c553 [Halomonas sp. A11-A]